jgi:ferredoxin
LNFDTGVLNEPLPGGVMIKRLDVIKPAVEADVIINLPKLKTHIYTVFTGAVKNTFGVIPGLKKPGYHGKLKTIDRFSEMLLDVYAFTKPGLSIMDAVVSMEGDGPGRTGKPRYRGVVLASTDGVALDAVACSVVGIPPEIVPTFTVARKRGLWSGDLGSIEVLGEPVEKVAAADFKRPSTSPDPAGYVPRRWLHGFVHSVFTSSLTARPVPRRGDCTACKTCLKSCPEKAIKIVEKLAVVDDERCIRCYCCHEMCPEGAIDLVLPRLGRVLQRTGRFGKE